MNKPTIALSHLRKSYSGHEVLHDISLTAQDGDVISLIGASGSGKSTLLRCIPFLEVPQAGEIAVGDEVVTLDNADEKLSREQRRRIKLMRMQLGFVFQGFNLWPHKTVLQNIIEAPIHVQSAAIRRPLPRPKRCCKRSGYTKSATRGRRSSPVVSSSAWRLPGRWRSSRKRYCLMNPLPRSTRSWWAKCCASSAAWRKRGAP